MKYFFVSIIFLNLVSGCARPNFARKNSLPTNPPPPVTETEKPSNPPQDTPGPTPQEKCDSNYLETLKHQCILIRWTTLPSEDNFADFTFDIKNKSSTLAVPIGTWSVSLWMPSMNHGSSPITVEEILSPSPGLNHSYTAKEVYFSMHGDWIIRFQFKAASGFEIFDNDQIVVPYVF